jgi:hypothetical protein
LIGVLTGLALLAAVLWPGRLLGPLDGAPLDSGVEAILIGVALPWLWWMQPGFLKRRSTQAIVVALLSWKMATWVGAAQEGWCAEFLTPHEQPADIYRLDRSWDARVDWRQPVPRCSAIASRPYHTLADFPAWIINIPFKSDHRLSAEPDWPPTENARPPEGRYAMELAGYLVADSPGELSFDVGSGVDLHATIDAHPIESADGRARAAAAAGVHFVTAHLDLRGMDWRFEPRWNDRKLFSSALTTTTAPNRVDVLLFKGAGLVPAALVLLLLALWSRAATTRLHGAWLPAAWVVALTLTFFAIGRQDSPVVSRLAVPVLLGAAALKFPRRLADMRGFLLLVGLPWLALFAGRGLQQVGRFTFYTPGDDWTLFQRYAHRIFMQGYWFEGGERTFWNQPLYRWIAGTLHIIFGDSSVGELYVDAFGLLVGAAFVYAVVRQLGSSRMAVVAGASTLAIDAAGPVWYLIGRGLSEIVAAALVYAAALVLLRRRPASLGRAMAAGVLSTAAFFTRLNLLVFVISLAALWLPWSIGADQWTRIRVWRMVPWRRPLTYVSIIALGVTMVAARTWYYTGQFSLFAGTQRYQVSTGLTLTTMFSRQSWASAFESVLMIITVQDPPRFDVRAALSIGGMIASVLALAHVPVVRRLPLSLAIMCIGAVAGGFVTRGTGYPGRFSMHLMPVATAAFFAALLCCAAAVQRHGAAWRTAA